MTLDIVLILVCAAIFEWQITKTVQRLRKCEAKLGINPKAAQESDG